MTRGSHAAAASLDKLPTHLHRVLAEALMRERRVCVVARAQCRFMSDDQIILDVANLPSRAARLRASLEEAIQRTRLLLEGLDLHRPWVKFLLNPTADLDERIDPNGCYVYCLWGDEDDRPVYVGESRNILARLGAHMSNPRRRFEIRRISLLRCESVEIMHEAEAQLIDWFQPSMNVRGIRDAV